MLVKLNRILRTNESTMGELYIDDKYICDTLEDRVRPLPDKCPNTPKFKACECKEKVYGETAIPEGTYELKMTYSNRFKKVMPEIRNVPHFLGIRIHSGSNADHSEGCVLVGEWDHTKGNRLNNSKEVFNKVYDILSKTQETITIIITNL